MDPLFEATASAAEIAEALRMWPELEGKRVRPLLVTAFGDIFVETDAGDVWLASPVELSCEQIASSVDEFQRLFSDPDWAASRLRIEVALAARDNGVERPHDQVFAIAPHPAFTGHLLEGELMPMTLRLWHHLALQIREQTSPTI